MYNALGYWGEYSSKCTSKGFRKSQYHEYKYISILIGARYRNFISKTKNPNEKSIHSSLSTNANVL